MAPSIEVLNGPDINNLAVVAVGDSFEVTYGGVLLVHGPGDNGTSALAPGTWTYAGPVVE